MKRKLKLKEKCVLRDAVLAGLIGTLTGSMACWVYASIGDRIFMGMAAALCAFICLFESDPTLDKLKDIRIQREEEKRAKEQRTPKKVIV